jgi:hypothetical protein
MGRLDVVKQPQSDTPVWARDSGFWGTAGGDRVTLFGDVVPAVLPEAAIVGAILALPEPIDGAARITATAEILECCCFE